MTQTLEHVVSDDGTPPRSLAREVDDVPGDEVGLPGDRPPADHEVVIA
jgi:hypothetical protein